MPTRLTDGGLCTEPIAVDGDGFGSILEHQRYQLLQIKIRDDANLAGGTHSGGGGLVGLARRNRIGQCHGDAFTGDGHGTDDQFILNQRVAFDLSGDLLRLLVDLGLDRIHIFGELFDLRIAVFELAGQRLTHLFARIGLQLLDEQAPCKPDTDANQENDDAIEPDGKCRSLLMDQSRIGEHGIHRTVHEIVDELQGIIVGFTATTSANGRGIIGRQSMVGFHRPKCTGKNGTTAYWLILLWYGE